MKTWSVSVLFLASFQISHGEPPGAETKPTPEPAKLKLRFGAYDGDPKNPPGMTFQINSSVGPTNFLKLGDAIPNTN